MRRLLLKELPRYECLLEAAQLYPELNPSACEVFLNLFHIVDLLGERETTCLDKFHLSPARFVVMLLLNKTPDEPMKSSEVADMAGVSKATMTGLLDGLKRDGFIERSDHQTDRRVVLVKLSSKGKEKLRKVMPDYFKNVSGMIRVLNEKERKQTVSLVQKIKSGMVPVSKQTGKK